MKSVLILDDIVPMSQIGYGYPRAKAVLDRLCALGFSPTLIPISGVSEQWYGDATQRPYNVLPTKQSELGRRVLEIAGKFSAIFVSRPRNLKLLLAQVRPSDLGIPIIYDAEAINSLRLGTQADISGRPLSREQKENFLAEEMALISQVDRVASVSEFEAAVIREHTGIVPTVLGHFHDVSVTETGFHEREGVLFLGSYFRVPCPNFDAATFLAEDIVPELRDIGVDVPIRIAGFKSERAEKIDAVRDCQSISIVGTLPELQSEYERARVVIIPTRIAAGIAYKYTEALSFGVPCVTSALIHSQVPASADLLPGCHEASDFASQVAQLHRSEEVWSKQRAAGLKIAEKHFSRDKFDSSLMELFS